MLLNLVKSLDSLRAPIALVAQSGRPILTNSAFDAVERQDGAERAIKEALPSLIAAGASEPGFATEGRIAFESGVRVVWVVQVDEGQAGGTMIVLIIGPLAAGGASDDQGPLRTSSEPDPGASAFGAAGALIVPPTGAIQALQRRFEDFLSCSADWLWECDAAGRLTLLSDRFTSISGRPAQLMLGKPISEIGSFKHPDILDLAASATFEMRQPFRAYRMTLVRDSGEIRHLELSGMPVFDEQSGAFLGYRGTGTDTTELVTTIAELQRSKSQLGDAFAALQSRTDALQTASEAAAASDQAKSRFLAQMSHELRTPLNAILGFSQLIAEEGRRSGSRRTDEYAGFITEGARHLLDVINDILDMSRIAAGRMKIKPEAMDVAANVRASLSLVSEIARQHDVFLRDELPTGPVVIDADPRACRQILINLLGNAIKFSPPGGIVTVELQIEQDSEVRLIIRDHGKGMTADEIDIARQPFGQVDGHYNRHHGGSGLGLPIAEGLIQLHGGQLEIESTPGKGTVVSVHLPFAAVASPADALPLFTDVPAEPPEV